jgi:hypothetical protein
VFGYACDIERTEILYTSLITQMSRALAAQEIPGTVTGVRAWRRSWMLGWTTSAVARVKAIEAQATHEAEDAPELMIVLRAHAALVRHRADEAYPRTRETRGRYTAVSAYHAGYSHGHETDA